MTSGPLANRISRSNSNSFITISVPLKPDQTGHVLVGCVLLFMRAFPALQVPDFKTAAPAHEHDFAFQSQLFAKIIGQKKAALFVCPTVLGAGMKVAQENAQVAWRYARDDGCG